MMFEYKDTIEYWNDVFSDVNEYDPAQVIPYEQIENALRWVSMDSNSVLDFGCGNGRVVFRCLNLGAKIICGLDISDKAISLAKKVVENNNLQDKATFICGSVLELNNFKDHQFDSVVLFNILDNLIPTDAQQVIEQIHRIVRPEGKILIKLNDYVTEDTISSSQEYNRIEGNFYKETSGLFLWNLCKDSFEQIITPFFMIEKYEEIEFVNYGVKNRMFYLRNV